MNGRVATADDVVDGEPLEVLVDGRHVVVARVKGRLYAIDGVCTHQYAALELGTLEGEVVRCHFHGAGFNIRTGAVVCPPATRPLETFRVTVQRGFLFVDGVPAEMKGRCPGLRDNG